LSLVKRWPYFGDTIRVHIGCFLIILMNKIIIACYPSPAEMPTWLALAVLMLSYTGKEGEGICSLQSGQPPSKYSNTKLMDCNFTRKAIGFDLVFHKPPPQYPYRITRVNWRHCSTTAGLRPVVLSHRSIQQYYYQRYYYHVDSKFR